MNDAKSSNERSPTYRADLIRRLWEFQTEPTCPDRVKRAIAEAAQTFEEYEVELTEAKRQRNDEQRLRLAAERRADETESEPIYNQPVGDVVVQCPRCEMRFMAPEDVIRRPTASTDPTAASLRQLADGSDGDMVSFTPNALRAMADAIDGSAEKTEPDAFGLFHDRVHDENGVSRSARSVKTSRDLTPSEAASFDKALARSQRRVLREGEKECEPPHCPTCSCVTWTEQPAAAGRVFEAPLPPEPGSTLCPHGLPLAENVCGPCSQGQPNRPAGTRRDE